MSDTTTRAVTEGEEEGKKELVVEEKIESLVVALQVFCLKQKEGLGYKRKDN